MRIDMKANQKIANAKYGCRFLMPQFGSVRFIASVRNSFSTLYGDKTTCPSRYWYVPADWTEVFGQVLSNP